ncbi:efflux transporter outer membrane subunit [Emcibacter sp. SYSU 3D8]|uniref:efflux transporter outer membrane subunit n=1 Tax=Emcibacter sp. SYSU 3D8 TaxID=3133969 RepID=UPI0031FF0F7D
MIHFRRPLASLVTAALLAGCNMTPDYHRPATEVPAAFKEEPGWRPARPADDVARGAWWRLFEDPVLDDLEHRVMVSNQNLTAALAAYEQARGVVREQRAGLFPTVDLQAGATSTGSFGTRDDPGTGEGGVSVGRRYAATIGATWEPDVWGRIRSGISQAGANAEASRADLASATLSAQGELALNYLQIRAVDAQIALLDDTIAAYTRGLEITTNRYNAGVAGKLDVVQAETQLRNARAEAAEQRRQRAVLEHAIAVLVGETPSSFSLEPVAWKPGIPDVPGVLPGDLLERRPDIAAAERRVAAANAAIGIERAAFFPAFSLSGDVGFNSRQLAELFSKSASVWSLGVQAAETLIDWGARSARVDQARAAWRQAAASYRQTVLTAFQQTEDQLAAARILAEVGAERAAAETAARRAERITQNQYLAGIVGYTDVIAAQATAFSAGQASITATLNRQTAAVSLIQAIGGHWSDAPLPLPVPEGEGPR